LKKQTKFLVVACLALAFGAPPAMAVPLGLPKFPVPIAPIRDPDAGLTTAQRIKRFEPFISEAARRFNVPKPWIRGVMRLESGGHLMLNGEPTQSRAGALGLMQLMPDTYRDMQARYGLGSEIANPRDNILAGTAYLGQLRKEWGEEFAFAAYNAGPGRVSDSLSGGGALPPETQLYQSNIANLLGLPLPVIGVKRHEFIPRSLLSLRAQQRRSAASLRAWRETPVDPALRATYQDIETYQPKS
jgi:soluble lytic murein transglycosylase-like protein